MKNAQFKLEVEFYCFAKKEIVRFGNVKKKSIKAYKTRKADNQTFCALLKYIH